MAKLLEAVTIGVIDYAKAGGKGPVLVVSFSHRFFMVNAAVLYLIRERLKIFERVNLITHSLSD
jgi:hypothetical protein